MTWTLCVHIDKEIMLATNTENALSFKGTTLHWNMDKGDFWGNGR